LSGSIPELSHVEKVDGMRPERNNRIVGDDLLNRSCAFGGRLESILLGDPPQNPFSTVSAISGSHSILVAVGEHLDAVVIRAARLAAILLPIARGLQHADKGPAGS
jgi:hypothetical protein